MSHPKYGGENWEHYLHKRLQSHWNLSAACVDSCEAYFIRHWEVSHYLSMSGLLGTRMIYQGHMYEIVQQPGMLLVSGQVALSFRKPKPEFNLPSYVLVKAIRK